MIHFARNSLVLLLTWLFFAHHAHACQICLPYPTRSLVDRLIEARHVVLTREDPAKPFTLATTRILKGGEPPSSPELFLDSQSRRVLAAYPDRSIVCIYSEQPGQEPWKRVATLTPELTPVLDEILNRLDEWTAHPELRASFFSRYLNHSDSQLSALAHLEVARAPYDTIKQLAGSLSTENIRQFLADFRMTEWHALYILILAQSGEPEDQQRIRETAESHARFSLTTQTAAWATAYIEIAENDALDFFDESYLRNPSRSAEELDAILAAYSVHGSSGHTELRPRIIDSYRALAESRPETLPRLVDSLTQWQDDALVERVTQLLMEQAASFDIEQTIALRNYLRSFEQAATNNPLPSTSPHQTLSYLLGGLLLLPLAIKLSRLRRHSA